MYKLIISAFLMLGGSVIYAGSVTYTYDNLGRVTKVTYSSGKSVIAKQVAYTTIVK